MSHPSEADAFRIYSELGRARSLELTRIKLGDLGYDISPKQLMAMAKLHGWSDKIAFEARYQANEIKMRASQAVRGDINRLDEAVASIQDMDGYVTMGMQAIAVMMDPANPEAIKIKTLDDVTRVAASCATIAKAAMDIRTALIAIAPNAARPVAQVGQQLLTTDLAPQIDAAVVHFRERMGK